MPDRNLPISRFFSETFSLILHREKSVLTSPFQLGVLHVAGVIAPVVSAAEEFADAGGVGVIVAVEVVPVFAFHVAVHPADDGAIVVPVAEIVFRIILGAVLIMEDGGRHHTADLEKTVNVVPDPVSGAFIWSRVHSAGGKIVTDDIGGETCIAVLFQVERTAALQKPPLPSLAAVPVFPLGKPDAVVSAVHHHEVGIPPICVVVGADGPIIVVVRIEVMVLKELSLIAGAVDAAGHFPDLFQRGKKHGGQNGDDYYPAVAVFLRFLIHCSLIIINLQLYCFVFSRKMLYF